MKDNEIQINIEIDKALLKQIKLTCLENNTTIKRWITGAAELMMNFPAVAEEYCRGLGWSPATANQSTMVHTVEPNPADDIIDVMDIEPAKSGQRTKVKKS